MLFRKPEYICKAAEYSLLFQPGGEILPCHYNRGYILGNYPNNSIADSWNSKKRKYLTKLIRQGKFHFSCDFCKTALKHGHINKAGLNKYDYIVPDKHKMPVSMEFQLDNICNLECVMCSGEYSSQIRKNREKDEPYYSPYDDNFVDQLKSFIPYLRQASFTGGEPFLFEIYYKIWDEIKKTNPSMQLYISTNGTVLNDKVKSYLNDLNFNLSISIDSFSKANYESIRKNAIFEDTINNIEYFLNYSKIKNLILNIKSLITPLNYADIPQIYTYCNRNQINFIPKTVLIPAFVNFYFSHSSIIEAAINLFENIHKETDSPTSEQNTKRLVEISNELKSILLKQTNHVKDYNNLSLYELKNLLLKSLLQQISEKEENKSITSFEGKLNFLYSGIDKEENLRKSIIAFLEISPQVLLSEFNRNDMRKIAERFKQCGTIV